MQRDLYIECLKKSRNETEITWNDLALKYGIASGKILKDRWQRIKNKANPIFDNPTKIEFVPEKKKYAPKVMIWDIETHLKNSRLFRHGKQYVSASTFTDYDTMICWSAKWLGDDTVIGDVQTPKEAIRRDHKRIVKSLWEQMEKADFYIFHNGINFDLPMVKTFFVEQRLGLPSLARSIDTCQIARSNFKFESNAMDYLCKRLGLNDGKIPTSVELWNNCYDGKQDALDYMFEYNKMDTIVLEDLYNVFIPYVPNFPNLGIWGDVKESKCPYCMGTNFHEKGFKYTPQGKFISYRCECQALFRSKENLLSTAFKKLQFVS